MSAVLEQRSAASDLTRLRRELGSGWKIAIVIGDDWVRIEFQHGPQNTTLWESADFGSIDEAVNHVLCHASAILRSLDL